MYPPSLYYSRTTLSCLPCDIAGLISHLANSGVSAASECRCAALPGDVLFRNHVPLGIEGTGPQGCHDQGRLYWPWSNCNLLYRLRVRHRLECRIYSCPVESMFEMPLFS
jgi:hypothetical protein